MASEFFGRQRECRFYTADCGNKMAVSVTGPTAAQLYRVILTMSTGIDFSRQNLTSKNVRF